MISPILSTKLTAFLIQNAAVRAILLATKSNIQLKFVHFNQVMLESNEFPVNLRERRLSPRLRKSLEKELGFQLKPKEPMSPFFKFLSHMRPSISVEYPNTSRKEQTAIIAKKWVALQDKEKEKFTKGFKSEKANYLKKIADYNSMLTEDQKTIIKEKIEEIGKKKLIKSYQKRARELNMPKKPMSSFLRYFHEQNDRQPNEEYKDHMKRVATRWMKLSKIKKAKYETPPEDIENYKKAMLVWEAKIMAMEAGGDEKGVEEYDEDEFEDEEHKNFPLR